MKCDLCLTYLAETERPLKLLALLFHGELPASPIGIGERVIAVASLKPGIAWSFPVFATSEEIIKRVVQASQHILQDVSSDILVLFSNLCLDLRQIVLLIVVADRLARILIGVFTFGKRLGKDTARCVPFGMYVSASSPPNPACKLSLHWALHHPSPVCFHFLNFTLF